MNFIKHKVFDLKLNYKPDLFGQTIIFAFKNIYELK